MYVYHLQPYFETEQRYRYMEIRIETQSGQNEKYDYSATITFRSLTAETRKKPKALPDKFEGGLVGLGVYAPPSFSNCEMADL